MTNSAVGLAGAYRQHTTKTVQIIFLTGTFLFIVVGQFWTIAGMIKPIRAFEAVAQETALNGFSPNGVYPTTRPLQQWRLKMYGSWMGSDASTGRMETRWYRPTTKFGVYFAGYPAVEGNRLDVEIEFSGGRHQSIRLEAPNPGESWKLTSFDLGPMDGAVRMRLVATDAATGYQGWFGFSEPSEFPSSDLFGLSGPIRIVLTVLACITFLIGPGLAIRGILASAGLPAPFILIPVPGVLMLSFWGLLTWYLRSNGIPDFGNLFGYALVAGLAYSMNRWRLEPTLTAGERKVLVFCFLVIVVACGKGLYSLGPVGETFGGTVSRTTEVGDRSDSRICFHIVQLVANGLKMSSPESRALFEPYFPTSRGPIAGLAAAPIVLLAGADVPTTEMTQDWMPFDAEGFGAYRILMVCLASTSLLAFYGFAAKVCHSERAALLGVALVALSPFFVHELYFTWPKFLAGTFILIAGYFALIRRYEVAGLAVGFAFLVHPSALLSVPTVLLLIVLVEARWLLGDKLWAATATHRKLELGGSALLTAIGPAAIVGFVFLAWNSVSVGADQGNFITYFLSANGVLEKSFGHCLIDRAHSVANTLVPLVLFLFFSDDPRVNIPGGRSPGIIHFYFGYWNTLPFAMGIALFFSFAGWMAKLAQRYAGAFAAFVAVPFGVFAIYWGSSDSGLMREGLQVWFLTIFAFLVWGISKSQDIGARVVQIAGKLQILRAVELLGMLLLPTIWTNGAILKTKFGVTDLAALAVMVGGTTLLAWQARGVCQDYGMGISGEV